MLPLHLVPLTLALGVLTLGAAPWVAPVYFVLMGMTAGASGSVLSALWAEMYGPGQVAAVRSVTAGLTIVGTAISPAVLGVLLERGVPFTTIQYGGLALAAAAVGSSWLALRRQSGAARNTSVRPVVGEA